MVVVPIELEDDARFAGGRVDQGSQEETAVSGKLPIWTALELQGELNRWKVETSNSRSSKYFEDDDNMMNLDETETQESKPMPLPLPGKDPAELRLFASTFIGGLQFGLFKIDHKDDSKASIIVGHHKLEGTKVDLEKPLVVLKRKKEEDAEGVKYKIQGVIRFKYVFSNRPRLLISKTNSS